MAALTDARVDDYARVLVETCIGVQAGMQVLVMAQPPARPLVEEVTRRVARGGAYALQRIEFGGFWNNTWLREAPDDLIDRIAPILAHEQSSADALIAIVAPENTRDSTAVPPDRLARFQAALRPSRLAFFTDEKPWVICHYPTAALAQDSGMTLPQLEDFLYASVLVDWESLGQELGRVKARFDRADTVRIVGDDTDLVLSLAGREGAVDAGFGNMPGGEVFYCPVEDSAEGTISFGEFPGCYMGHQVPGIRFRFEQGEIVEASAAADEEFLLEILATDAGARRLGEFGIGGNPAITRHLRNPYFDEKIEGTCHLAVGQGFPQVGGLNTSAIHWDIVKDLRRGGELYADDELVQKDGVWRL